MNENELLYQAHEIAYEQGAARDHGWSDGAQRIESRGKLAWRVERAIRATIDAFRTELEDLRERLGADTGHDCSICGERIHGAAVAIESARGQRFQHPACHYRQQYDAAQDGLLEIAAALHATGALAQLRRAAGSETSEAVQFEIAPRTAQLLLRHLAPALPSTSPHAARR
jgi:bacterioferritin-associated ferredoxin